MYAMRKEYKEDEERVLPRAFSEAIRNLEIYFEDTQMKKSLLALAIMGSFTGIAAAQSNVTIYGVVDLGLAHENNGATAGNVTRMDSGILNGSRLGFRGTEDLGGGMSAIFTLENGFSADTGALGLSSGFGALKLGRQKTVVYDNSTVFDPFGDALAGDSARLFNYSGSRTNNVISYSYEGAGFRGQLQYGLGEVAGNTSGNRMVALAAGYKNGPVDVVLTHHRNNDVTGDNNGKTTLLGGTYNFGVVKAYAAYAYIRLWDKNVDNADAKQAAIGYVHDLSKRTALYASYAHLTNDARASYQVPAPGNTDKLFNVGIRHTF